MKEEKLEMMIEPVTQQNTLVGEEIHNFRLDEYDANHALNIRRDDKYTERIERKMQEILADGFIRTPLNLCLVKGQKTLKLSNGFLRHGALLRIFSEMPDVWAEKFEGRVPYTITVVETEEERERIMLDHGSEEPLDEFEILLAVKRYMRQGKTEEEIAVLLTPLFYQACKVSTKREFQTMLKEFKEKGHVGKAYTLAAAKLHFWRRRVQNAKRIINAGETAINEYKRYVDGQRPAFKETQVEKLKECKTPEEVLKCLAPEEKEKGEPQKKGLGRARLMTIRSAIESPMLGRILDTILGELPPDEMEKIDSELVELGI